MAGVPTSFFEKRLPAGTSVVRVMTNTPVLVDEAMTVASPGAHASAPTTSNARASCSRRSGKFMVLPEYQQDAVTALSGSGPAYFFYLVEAMTDAGILLGLPRAVAAELLVQTALGAAVMLRDSGEHPVQLRESVTSPAGTTIAAIRELENHGVRAALLSGDRGRPRPEPGARARAQPGWVDRTQSAAARRAGVGPRRHRDGRKLPGVTQLRTTSARKSVRICYRFCPLVPLVSGQHVRVLLPVGKPTNRRVPKAR